MAAQLEFEAARQKDAEVASRLRESAAALRSRERRERVIYRIRSSSRLTAVLLRELADLGEEVVPVLQEAGSGPAASLLARELLGACIRDECRDSPAFAEERRDTLFELAVNAFFPRNGTREPTADQVAESIRMYFAWGAALSYSAEQGSQIDLTPLMAWLTLQVVPVEISAAAPPEKRIRACCEWLRSQSGRLVWDGRTLTSAPDR